MEFFSVFVFSFIEQPDPAKTFPLHCAAESCPGVGTSWESRLHPSIQWERGKKLPRDLAPSPDTPGIEIQEVELAASREACSRGVLSRGVPTHLH